MLILINVWKDFNFVLSCRASLEDRLKLEEHSGTSNMADSAVGSKQLTFKLQKVNFNVLINPKCIRCLSEVQISNTISIGQELPLVPH